MTWRCCSGLCSYNATLPALRCTSNACAIACLAQPCRQNHQLQHQACSAAARGVHHRCAPAQCRTAGRLLPISTFSWFWEWWFFIALLLDATWTSIMVPITTAFYPGDFGWAGITNLIVGKAWGGIASLSIVGGFGAASRFTANRSSGQ